MLLGIKKHFSFISVLFLFAFFCVSCATQNMAQAAQKMSLNTIKNFLPMVINSGEAKLRSKPGDWTQSIETGSYCVMYANAFIQGPASMLAANDYQKRDKAYQRAKKEYLRGVKILRTAFNKKYPGVNEAYGKGELNQFLTKFTKDDAGMIYWLVAGTMAAFSINPMDVSLGVKLPELTALIKRAYELDPDYSEGSLDDFFILFYGSLPPEMGGDKAKAKIHYEAAIKKSAGRSAGPYVSWAKTINIPEQNYREFKENLNKALAIDPEAYLPLRLNNLIAQKTARHLLKTAEYHFINIEE